MLWHGTALIQSVSMAFPRVGFSHKLMIVLVRHCCWYLSPVWRIIQTHLMALGWGAGDPKLHVAAIACCPKLVWLRSRQLYASRKEWLSSSLDWVWKGLGGQQKANCLAWIAIFFAKKDWKKTSSKKKKWSVRGTLNAFQITFSHANPVYPPFGWVGGDAPT